MSDRSDSPPDDEAARLAALGRYAVFAESSDSTLERIAELASRLLRCSTVLISFLDHETQRVRASFSPWSHEGVIPRARALCDRTLGVEGVTVLSELEIHRVIGGVPPFPGMPKMCFYAGVPIRTPDGFNIGTLCLLDENARRLSDFEQTVLQDLASVIMDGLQLRTGEPEEQAREDDDVDTGDLTEIIEGLGGEEEGGRPQEDGGQADDFDSDGGVSSALSIERDFLRGIIDTSFAAIILLDRRGRILFANERATEIFGRTPQEMVNLRYGPPAIKITDFDGRPLSERQLPHRPVLERGLTVEAQRHVIETPRGSRRILSINGAPIKSANGTITGAVLSITDISERARAQEAIAAFGEQLKQLHRIHTTEYGSLDELFSDYLKTGCRLLGFSTGIVSRVREETYEILASHSHLPALGPGKKFALAETICERVVREARTVVYPTAEALEASNPGHPALQELALETYLGTPLVVGGEVFGTLNFTSMEPRVLPIGSAEIELLELMAQGMGRLIAVSRSEEARKAQEQRLANLESALSRGARRDAVTGLPNRYLFEEHLQQSLAQARRSGRHLGVLWIRLRGLRRVRSEHGEAVGDALLQGFVGRLQGRLRRSDTFARVGEDELALILTLLSEPAGAAKVAQVLLDSCEAPYTVEDREVSLSLLVGIGIYPQDGSDEEELQRAARAAVTLAADDPLAGDSKGALRFYSSDPRDRPRDLVLLEQQLADALKKKRLTVRFQPQVDLETGTIVGVEAALGVEALAVEPEVLADVAERSGLVLPAGRWLLGEATRLVAAWGQDDARLRVTVPISALQFAREDVARLVEDALGRSGLEPERLELEVAEDVFRQNLEDVTRRLRLLRDLGVSIAVKDFGCGNSSLTYLQRLAVDWLKIDRMFVQRLVEPQRDSDDRVLVEALIRLAHGLTLKARGSGVEAAPQLKLLIGMGCDEVQGELISPWLEAATLTTDIENLKSRLDPLLIGGEPPQERE